MIAASPVAVRGRGLLASILTRRLAAREFRENGAGRSDPVVILVTGVDQTEEFEQLVTAGESDAVLFVGLWRSLIYIGPFWRAGRRGCPRCLLTRVTDSPNGPEQQGRELVYFEGLDLTPAGTGPAVSHIAATLVETMLAETQETSSSELSEVTIYNSQTGEIARYSLIPDSTCRTCGDQARSTLPQLTPASQPLLKPTPDALRLNPIKADELKLYTAPLGLFRNLKIDLQSPFGASSIEVPATKGRPIEPAMGRAVTYRDSRAIAILEGLERYCGMHCGGNRTRIRASFAEVADHAIYPPSLGTHPPESFKSEYFPFREFANDVVIDWVEGHSFAREGPTLVPERVAFWGPRIDGEIAFLYETSNGCALGSSMEEAILHGLRELIERDSFLMTWYRQLELPEIDLRNDVDPEFRAMLGKSELFTGFRFRAFVSTMEYGMPSTWIVAEGQDPNGPAVLAGAGAHPDPREATLGGISELTKLALAIKHYYSERRAEGLEMLDDPFLVQKLEHHPLVNCLPEARGRFSFLLDRKTDPVSLASIPSSTCLTSNDLRADLALAVRGLLDAGMDVIAVDQTMPELAQSGLVCVKVIVPGLLPMTFGHINRRTENLPRLKGATGPYRSALPEGAMLGQNPHPFH
ncbi:MAG TPA: TOMM precursor leader peptide-binding protein [Pyrinomonadaceae bacterium]|nr:TOMM precursor leader peptide-binding protein [Pyrinomonadaceae bacterium]